MTVAVRMCQMKEWDSSNVIMTGNSDGVVRVGLLFFTHLLRVFTS